MKMTSGVRKIERQKRALERLQAQNPERWFKYLVIEQQDGTVVPDTKQIEARIARRDAEIATLKKRTGQLFS